MPRQKNIDAFLKEKGYADENGVIDDAKLAKIDDDYDALLAEKERLSAVPDGETEEAKKTREEALAKVEADIKAYDSYKTEKANQDLAKGDLA